MNITTTNKHVYTEADIQSAISAYKTGQYSSIRSLAIAFCVPYTTLYYRMPGLTTRQKSYENAQNLLDAEEISLVKIITRLTITGYPALPTLVVEMAKFIRVRRVVLSKTNLPPSSLTYRLGKN